MFTLAAVALLGVLATALVATMHGSAPARVAALQLAGTITLLVILVLAADLSETALLPVAVVLAVVTVIGGLLYARFLEHWL